MPATDVAVLMPQSPTKIAKIRERKKKREENSANAQLWSAAKLA